MPIDWSIVVLAFVSGVVAGLACGVVLSVPVARRQVARGDL